MMNLSEKSLIDDIYQDMCVNHGQEIMEYKTKNITDNLELIKFFSEFEETKFESVLRQSSRKDATKSKELREKGNKLYSSKKNKDALKTYTEAIKLAPHYEEYRGMELSLAFANRSAVYFQMKLFRSALQDIDLAVEAGYPTDLLYKLHERKVKCYRELNLQGNALRSAQDCLESLQLANIDKVKKEQMETDLEVIISNLNKTEKNSNNDLQVQSDSTDEVPQIPVKARNKSFPGLVTKYKIYIYCQVNVNKILALSDGVKIKFDNSRGRYGVATRDIKLGEILLVETPPVFYVNPDCQDKCSHCSRFCETPLPSPYSSQVVFCSRKCLRLACDSYHTTEAKFAEILSSLNLKKQEWILGLRAVTTKPLSYFLDNEDIILGGQTPNFGVSQDACKSEEVYKTDDLKSIFNLVTHHSSWEWSTLTYKSFIAIFFIRCLQKANYFGPTQSEGLSLGKQELLVGSFMCHVMEVATMNSHEVGVMECPSGESWMTAQTVGVGCSLEPTLVLLNHSCDPTLLRVNSGHTTVAFASRNIKKGEEITDCYSHPFDVTPLEERGPYLEDKYKFKCSCEPCLNNWKTATMLPKSFNDLEPEQLKLTEANIGSVQERIKSIMTIGAKISQFQKCEDFEGAVNLYPKFYAGLNEILRRPHQFFVMSRRSLCTCLWVLYGNKVRR